MDVNEDFTLKVILLCSYGVFKTSKSSIGDVISLGVLQKPNGYIYFQQT